jgi:hypothetical protein
VFWCDSEEKLHTGIWPAYYKVFNYLRPRSTVNVFLHTILLRVSHDTENRTNEEWICPVNIVDVNFHVFQVQANTTQNNTFLGCNILLILPSIKAFILLLNLIIM